MQNGNGRLPQLDGIRGVAVLTIVWWHYFNSQAGVSQASPSWLKHVWQATSLAWSGVDLFFVLSGFLITGILIDESRARNILPVFYLRRAARILPLYALVLVFAAVMSKLVGHQPEFSWLFADLPPVSSLLSLTQNIVMGAQATFGGRFLGMTWSLAVEEQFYLIWPLLVLLCGCQRKLLFVSVALCLCAPCLRLCAPYLVGTVNMPHRMDSLLIGAIAAILVRNDKLVALLRSRPRYLYLLFVVLACAVAVMARFNWIFGVLDHSILALFYGTILLHSVIFTEGKLAGMLSSQWLRWFGMLSYAIYMFHEPVVGLLHGAILGTDPSIATIPGILVTLLSLGLVLVAAALSARFFESRFLEWGRQFKYARQQESLSGNSSAVPIASGVTRM
jgi:peptidoglycan/LPS O-acetylase OafA/YrhL